MASTQPIPGTPTGLLAGEIDELTDAATRANTAAGRSGGAPYVPPRKPFKFGRWFRATGWRHVVGIVMVLFALLLLDHWLQPLLAAAPVLEFAPAG